MAQLVASVSAVELGGVAEVVGLNLARGKIFTISLHIYIYILNETSKPPVNTAHFFNIAHLLLNCLTRYLTQYIRAHVSVD